MNILECIKIASYRISLQRLNRKLNHKHVIFSDKILNKTEQRVKYITLNVDKGDKNARYIEHILRLQDNILNNNPYVLSLMDKTKQYLDDIHSHKLNPKDLSFPVQIKLYEDLIFSIQEKPTKIASLRMAIEQYDSDNYIYSEWKTDYDLYEQLILADALRISFINHHVGYKTKLKLIQYKTIATRIKQRQKGFNFDLSNYTRVLEFYINMESQIQSHNRKFLDDNIKGFYEIHKQKKYSLIDHFRMLTSIEDLTMKEIEDYFDKLQTQSSNDFEMIVEKNLRKVFPSSKIIRSLYLETNNIQLPTTEIDMILFLKGHIFVLECKDYQGTIFGSYTKDPWLQIIKTEYRYKSGGKVYTRSNSYEMINPIKQNEMHINVLKKYAAFEYKNVVLFSDSSELKVSSKEVYHPKDFFKYLDQLEDKTAVTDEIYYKLLLENKGLSKEVKSDHIIAIQRKYVN